MNVEEYSVDAQGLSSLTKVLVRGTGMGGGIGSVLYTEDSTGNGRSFFCYNAIGSTVALTDSTGTVTSTTDYEAFGKVVSSTGSSTETRKFSTKERDVSTGLDNFGFRYFDWELGRFITRDPSGYPDGANNYLYCSNNPINFIDPLGLSTLEEDNKRFEEGEANFGNYRSNMPNRKKLPDAMFKSPSENLRDISNSTKSQSTAFITSLSADIMDMSPSPEEVVKQTTIHAVKTVKNKGVVDGGKQLAGESYEVAKEAAGTNDIVRAFDFSDEYSWKEQAIYGASGLAKTAFIVTGGVLGLRKLTGDPKSGFNGNAKLEAKALMKQGLSRKEAFQQIRNFNTGNADGYVFHFTNSRGAYGILSDAVIKPSARGMWGPGVYTGTTPKPGPFLKNIGWGLGGKGANVRIPIKTEQTAIKPWYPPKTSVFRKPVFLGGGR